MNRLGRVIDGFDDAGIDALIVSDASNIRYLTGFSGSHGTLLITAAGPTLLTDNRYAERAAEEMAVAGVNAALVIAPGAARQQFLGVLEPASRIGIEAQHVSWEAATSLVADLGEERVVKTAGIVEAAREHKDADEIETMRRAASIADAALTEASRALRTRDDRTTGRTRARRPGARWWRRRPGVRHDRCVGAECVETTSRGRRSRALTGRPRHHRLRRRVPRVPPPT